MANKNSANGSERTRRQRAVDAAKWAATQFALGAASGIGGAITTAGINHLIDPHGLGIGDGTGVGAESNGSDPNSSRSQS